jgi:hypothetical protein
LHQPRQTAFTLISKTLSCRYDARLVNAREQHLNALVGRQAQAWQQVTVRIDAKRPKEYDAAVELLIDLKALAERDGQMQAFRRRVRQLRERRARKPSLLDRLDRNRLR